VTAVPWHDQVVAARVRAHMPDESPIDLDEHARLIGRLVAAADLANVTRDAAPAKTRQRERELHVELIERARDHANQEANA
jgi:hypothetical protein